MTPNRLLDLALRSARQSLLIDPVRYAVAGARFIYYSQVRRILRTLPGAAGAVPESTVPHNLKGLRDLAVKRSLPLVRVLASIEVLGPDARVLSVGPRTEGELLSLVAHGFTPRCVRGMDLISSSPWVDPGDMHAMPYADGSWDAVLLGWVISYSTDKPRAVAEVVRVTRPGGVVAVGVEYNPLTDDQLRDTWGYVPGDPKRITTAREILALFGEHVDRVYFTHDIAPERAGELGAICAVFSLRG